VVNNRITPAAERGAVKVGIVILPKATAALVSRLIFTAI